MIGEAALKNLDLKYHTHDKHDSPGIACKNLLGAISDINGYTTLLDFLRVIASDNPTSTSAGSASTQSTTYVKLKEIKIAVFSGTYRIKWTGYTSNVVYHGKGQIYKNGVAFGTEYIINSTSTTYTEDLDFERGDTVELWAKRDSSDVGDISVSNLIIAGDPLFGEDIQEVITN